MPNNAYTSAYTGAQIDAAIEKINSLAWGTTLVTVGSGIKGSASQAGISWDLIENYPLVILTGYKEGVSSVYTQTTSIILSTTAIASRGAGGEYQINLPFSIRGDSTGYPAWSTTIFFWRAGGKLHWETATDYSGSTEFVVTRVEGLNITKTDAAN